MVVSLWLVIPIAAIWLGLRLFLLRASVTTETWEVHISIGSCSTQPALGNFCSKSFCATASICPSLLKIIALELVVPWSKANMYWWLSLMGLLIDDVFFC